MKRIILILTLILLFDCEYRFTNDLTWYEIEKGNHHSINLDKSIVQRNFVSRHNDSKLEFDAVFRNGTLYSPSEVGNHWNKLYGVSCSPDHQKYSMRIGWRATEGDSIEIAAYYYNGSSQWKAEHLGYTKQFEMNLYTIEIDKDNYYVSFKDAFLTIPINNNCYLPNRFRLFPYFGGQPTAPQTMKFLINEHD